MFIQYKEVLEECVGQMQSNNVHLVEDEDRGWNNMEGITPNILIEGENYHALNALKHTHTNKIDVIYIDPPYNTGSKDFVYNDNYSVDVSDKHSRWLSFMERRLRIARELLTNDGIIMISIDDHEYAHLKLLCDEVFSEQNYICTFTWEMKRGARGVPPRNLLVRNHEYILCYGKSGGAFSFRGDDRSEGDYNKDEDGRLWNNESMKATGKQNNYFDIIDPSTGVAYHGNWAFSSSTIQDMIMKGLVIFPTKKGGTPRQKKYIDTYTNTTKAIVTSLGWFSTENATKELMDIFDGKKVFDFPKPLELMKYILKQATKKDSIVLDFFAGSGTTGQAVQELNREDGGSRQFILITNNQNNIACDVTYTRLQRTITRDTNLIYKVISNDIILSQE